MGIERAASRTILPQTVTKTFKSAKTNSITDERSLLRWEKERESSPLSLEVGAAQFRKKLIEGIFKVHLMLMRWKTDNFEIFWRRWRWWWWRWRRQRRRTLMTASSVMIGIVSSIALTSSLNEKLMHHFTPTMKIIPFCVPPKRRRRSWEMESVARKEKREIDV